MDSYPSRIWHTILEVKEKCEKNLNDKKQYQMCRKMFMVTCSLESWNFLVTNLVRSGALVIQFSHQNTRKRIHCDLSLSSITDRQSFILLHLDTCQSMDGAHKIFGHTFGVGIRNEPPSKGESLVRMKDSDAIKFIDVASNLYDNLPVVWPDHCKIFVPQQGVDFIYDKTTRSLKIRVWYTKFLGSNPVIRTTLQLLVVNNNLPQIINEDINMWKQHVLPGISFAMHDGEKVLVV
jgi:hypothetical protein